MALIGLLIVVGVATVAPRLGVAAPLVLVVLGISASFLPGVPEVNVPPEAILAFVLPPILYSAAVNVPLVDLRRNLKAITSLSVLLVIVSAVVSGLVLHLLLPGLDVAAAIALGAVISPPDAVAATAIGKRLGLPPRLVTVLEGEGLVNDASALVLLRSAIAATAGTVSLWQIAGDFVYAVAGAIVVGLALGWATVLVRSRLRSTVLNTTISFAVPFLAYIPAEEINASGVLAVVVAGLVTGHASATYFSAQDRISERLNWRTIQFILENGVFLLMGFEIKTLIEEVHDDNLGVWHAIGLGLLITVLLIVIRIVFVAPLIAVLKRDQRRAVSRGPALASALDRLDAQPIPDQRSAKRTRRVRHFLHRKQADVESLAADGLSWRGGAVLAWSGMRGVVTLAAAQSLPLGVAYRPQLILIAFTVALVTLLGQGSTLPLLIRKLRIVGSDADADRAELADLIGDISQIGRESLDARNLVQDDGTPFDHAVIERVRSDSILLSEAIAELTDPSGIGPHEQQRALRLRILQAERAALLDARSTGSYSSRVLARAQDMLDLEESRLQHMDEDNGGN
nr:sodium:proton antiporter [Leifsonia psychrotolerans]